MISMGGGVLRLSGTEEYVSDNAYQKGLWTGILLLDNKFDVIYYGFLLSF